MSNYKSAPKSSGVEDMVLLSKIADVSTTNQCSQKIQYMKVSQDFSIRDRWVDRLHCRIRLLASVLLL